MEWRRGGLPAAAVDSRFIHRGNVEGILLLSSQPLIYLLCIMARNSFARLRAPPRSTTTRWCKAIVWALIFFVVTTYTFIASTGMEYPRLRVLQWVLNDYDGDRDLPQYEQHSNLSWVQLQKLRVGVVFRTCQSLGLNQTIDYAVMKHMLVDTHHKALMCFVPKVACTSWKRMWFWLVGLLEEDEDIMDLTRNQVHGRFLPTLSSSKFTDKDRKEILSTYKKFLFTRHPMERLISAYRDKLENVDLESNFDFHKHIGQEIEYMLRGKFTGGHNTTFKEFIRWVTPANGTWTIAQKNEHWRPIVELCTPCAVQYDAIGRYENLQHEANETLHWLGAGEFADRFPKPDRAFHATENHRKYLSQLSAEDKLQFLRTYILDFLLFNYSLS